MNGIAPYNPPQRTNSLKQVLLMQALQQQAQQQAAQQPSTGQSLLNSGLGLAKGALAKEIGSSLFGDTAATAAVEPSTALFGGASNIGGTTTMPSSLTNMFGASSANASTAVAPEATSLTNFVGSATPYIGGLGAALGTYGAIKGIKDKNPIGAGLGGLGAGLGLGAMGLLGPVGIGAVTLAPVAGALINKMGDKDRWKGEQKSRDKLANSGVTGWKEYAAAQPRLTKGRSFDSMQRKDLAPDFIGNDANGRWVNNKFNMSRNVADLRPEDIMGYSAFGEKYGNDWFGKFNNDQRKKIADAYLKAGAVSEGKGQIKLKTSQAIDDQINSLLGNKPQVVTKPLPLNPANNSTNNAGNGMVNKPANLNNSTLKPQINNLIRRAR